MNANEHVRHAFQECVWRIVCNLRRRALATGRGADAVVREFPFLGGYIREVQEQLPEDLDWDASLGWFAEHAPQGPEPLWADRTLCLAMLFAGLVEEDARFAQLYGSLTGQPTLRRPTLGLLQELLGLARPDRLREFVQCGLLDVMNPDAPSTEWALRIVGPVWKAFCGHPDTEPATGLTHRPHETLVSLDGMVMEEAQRERLRPVVELLRQQGRVLLLRGLPGSDRLETAGALARALGMGLLVVEAAPQERTRLVDALCVVSHSVPAFVVDMAAGETFAVPKLGCWNGPVIVIAGVEGGLAPTAAHTLTVEMPLVLAREREAHWRGALGEQAPDAVDGIAEAFSMQPKYIRESARLASDYAALGGRRQVTFGDVRLATRAVNRQVLDPLAARLPEAGGWRSLVLGHRTYEELRNLERRCRYRERLAAASGASFPGGLNRGVRALFEGPSGTGKTLAARVLGCELGLDVHRIDLAAVVNKYVGETEKNLSRVLCRAEDLDLILLLDEGDSLMSRRTDVRSANDRYANLETNYMLQRLETYSGICLVTTNAANAIDSAFRRRFDCVVKFQPPEAPERLHLWTLHLPDAHAVPFEDVDTIALRYQLTGGQIRNACVHASLLALSTGAALVGTEHVVAAVNGEYRKAGATPPESAAVAVQPARESLVAFLESIH